MNFIMHNYFYIIYLFPPYILLSFQPNQEQWDARIWEFICDSEDDLSMWQVAMQTTTGPSASETNIKRTNSFTTIG